MKHKQSGMATMMISTILLVSIGMMSVYTAQVSVMEQKISANHYRSTQAFEAAQAGLDNAIYNLDVDIAESIGQGQEGTSAKFLNDNALASLSSGGDTHHAQTIGDFSLKFRINSDYPDMIDFELSGYAGDNSSANNDPNQVIYQSVKKTPLLNSHPPAPLVAKGAITVGGNVAITNKYEDALAASWSGGAAAFTTGAGDATVDVTTNDGSATGGYYQNQAELAAMSDDKYFNNFFSESKTDLKQRSEVVDCQTGCTENNLDPHVKNDGRPEGNNIVWVDAKIDPPEGSPEGTEPTYEKLTIDNSLKFGTSNEPMILIVDGEIEINDINANFYGVVYTTRDFNNGIKQGKITGSLITEGDVNAEGDLELVYSNTVLNNMDAKIARYTRVAGSWRDF